MERKLSFRFSVNFMMILGAISTACVFVFGHMSPVVFLASFVIYGIANSAFRPYVTNILLDIHEGDTGSATALINFIFTMLGAIGMVSGSLPFPNYVLCVAISMLIFIGLAFII